MAGNCTGSHNSEDIAVLCDEVYEMEKGVLSKISS